MRRALDICRSQTFAVDCTHTCSRLFPTVRSSSRAHRLMPYLFRNRGFQRRHPIAHLALNHLVVAVVGVVLLAIAVAKRREAWGVSQGRGRGRPVGLEGGGPVRLPHPSGADPIARFESHVHEELVSQERLVRAFEPGPLHPQRLAGVHKASVEAEAEHGPDPLHAQRALQPSQHLEVRPGACSSWSLFELLLFTSLRISHQRVLRQGVGSKGAHETNWKRITYLLNKLFKLL